MDEKALLKYLEKGELPIKAIDLEIVKKYNISVESRTPFTQYRIVGDSNG